MKLVILGIIFLIFFLAALLLLKLYVKPFSNTIITILCFFEGAIAQGTGDGGENNGYDDNFASTNEPHG